MTHSQFATEAWLIDASALSNPNELAGPSVLGPYDITHFVTAPHHQAPLIIAAQKGAGKTLALRKRSYLYRNSRQFEGIKCIPENELVEKLGALMLDSFNKDRLLEFRTDDVWFIIWATAICAAIMNRLGDQIPDQMRAVLPLTEGGIGEFVSYLAEVEHGRLTNARALLNTVIRPYIRRCREPIAVFLDSIEEAMENHAGYELREYVKTNSSRYGHLDEKVWLNSQIALIDVATEFRNLNSHIKIFAAVRIEAFDRYPGARRANLGQSVARVIYEKDDIRTIFYENIRLTEEMQRQTGQPLLADINAPTPLQRFFGTKTDSVRHWRVPESEDIFDALWRHTLGRPRDVVALGRAILRISANKRSDRHVISDCVKTTAADAIYENFKREVFPFWDTDIDRVFELVPHNILRHDDLQQLRVTLGGPLDPFLYLYRKGLLGVPNSAAAHGGALGFVQEFLDCSSDNEAYQLPTSDYYLFHPCLSKAIRLDHGHTRDPMDYVSASLIVGRGLPIPRNFRLPRLVVELDSTFNKLKVRIDNKHVNALSDFSHVTTALFAALIMSFIRHQRQTVSVDQILDEIDRLSARALLPPTLGKKQIAPRRYMEDQFNTTQEKKNDALANIRAALAEALPSLRETHVFSQNAQSVTLGEFAVQELQMDMD